MVPNTFFSTGGCKWRASCSLQNLSVQRIRQSVNRGAPFGLEGWMRRTAILLGLDASLRPIGRPPKLVEI